MAATPFTGQLTVNELYSTLRNAVLSRQTFADNIKGTYSQLVDKFRAEGSRYGDTIVKVATDALITHPYAQPNSGEGTNRRAALQRESSNLLDIDLPTDPMTQEIKLDTFRQIRLSLEPFFSARAWGKAGAFQQFNDVMKSWIRTTKAVYDATLVNVYVGTTETDIGKQEHTITPVDGQNDALTMAVDLANLLTEMKDINTDYSDYQFLRSYAEGDLIVIWNSKHYNQLKKADLPQVFHTEGLLNEFEQIVLPSHYFGTVNTGEKAGDGATVFARYEQTINGHHYWPGQVIKEGDTAPAGMSYTEDDSIAYKVIHKDSLSYMSGFEVQTSFLNPRTSIENFYLTFAHNTLQYWANYPFITARFAE